ncbi:unnamed protein product [Cuscuta epithymum]|uniref:Uncharacterized protein n=1 Tax=Cuscuta epithymum TaxID=186058 RepID=A0AAV0CAI9_9ASTE|nr:unnamed protein product [Cuscuta epithymum]
MSRTSTSCGSSPRRRPKFEQIGKAGAVGCEVIANVEQNKIKKLTGFKDKELLLWDTISEISVDDPPTEKIYFYSSLGIGKTFLVSAFEILKEELKKLGEVKEV